MASDGYLFVTLTAGIRGCTVPKVFNVARLVASIFISLPLPGMEVNHEDGRHGNNDWRNLEWLTSAGNKRHAVDALGYRGTRRYNAKLTGEKVARIRRMGIMGVSARRLSDRSSVSESAIHHVLAGRNWKHVNIG